MKITAKLNPVQEAYFNEVAYSLDFPHKRASHSDIINHMLGELAAFEKIREDQLSNFLDTENHEAWHKFIEDNREGMNSDLDRKLIKKLVNQAV